MFRLPFLLAMLAVATVVACDGPGTLESPLDPQFAVAADSADGPRVTLAQAVAGLPVQLGDVVVVTIISAACTGQGSVTAVSGVLSGTVSTDACHAVGASLTLGPAPSDGELTFSITDPRFGSGSFQVSGSFPSFTVGLDDGFGDGDFNDNVLSVTIQRRCEVGDPVLDSDAVRQGLLDALAQSGAFDRPPADRREVGGYVYQQADGAFDVRPRTPPDPDATPCRNAPGGPQLRPGETVVGAWHTHPFAAGDTLPSHCNPGSSATYAYDNLLGGGGSAADWEFADQFDIPMYIIDNKEVFRLDPRTPPGMRPANPNRFTWRNTDCAFDPGD